MNYTPHTDLACEGAPMKNAPERGVEYEETEADGIKVSRMSVSAGIGESTSGRRAGKYITIFSPKMNSIEDNDFENLKNILGREITELVAEMTDKRENICILVAGLGNRSITADAIGPRTVDKLSVTRHIKEFHNEYFEMLGAEELCAIAPGVVGQTGIETVELIRGAAKCVAPDIIVVVDALAARSCERLAATVQLCNNGISPGSGIGNKRKSIDKETTGAPVLVIGVPTVVNSSTLVYDALSKAGISEFSDEVKRVIDGGAEFFVSPRESDVITERVSDLLSDALNFAFVLKDEIKEA